MKSALKVKLVAEDNEKLPVPDPSDVQLLDFVTVQMPDNSSIKVNQQSLDKVKELGCGLDGRVLHMVHKDSKLDLAVKKVFLRADNYTGNDCQNIARAVARLTEAKSPYLIRYYGAFFAGSTEAWICKELMDISLEAIIHKSVEMEILIPEQLLAKIAFSVLNVLEYLDSTWGILHRRVKPSNILLNRSGEVKLSAKDWNILSDLPSADEARKNYTAPERLEGDQRPNSRGDVWSLGVCLVEAATGVFPYAKDSKTLFEQLYQIVTEPAPVLTPGPESSEEFCAFVALCLEKDQKQRSRPIELLEHPWLKGAEDSDTRQFISKIVDGYRS